MMSVPTRVKTPPPVQPTYTPPTPLPAAPQMNNSLSRGVPRQPTQQTLPPLPQLISQQPLPDPLTDQYNQQQALYQQALQQLQSNQQSMLGMQNQLNRMSATDPTARLNAQYMAMLKGDPYADLRAQQAQMNAIPQRLSMAWSGLGY